MLIRAAASALLLTSTAALAQAFVRTQIDDTGVCLYWSQRQYTFHLDSAGDSQLPGDGELAAIEAAFQSWQTVSNLCSDFQFVEGDRVTAPEAGYTPGGTDNQNVITFREQSCADVVPADDPCLANDSCANAYRCWDHDALVIALTTTTFNTHTGEILDADIELNAAPQFGGPGFLFTTVSSPPCTYSDLSTGCVATDVQNTLTHEIGHVIGLAHTPNPGSTMEATAPLGETHKRVIDIGTAQGFCSIYPPGRPSTSACELTGQASEQIVASSAGTGPIGCGVAGGGAGLLGLLGGALWGTRRRRRRR